MNFSPSSETQKCDVVLVAGGSGQRFQSKLPKQFESILGRPLYLWSLDTFLMWPTSGLIMLVVPQEWVDPVRDSLKILGHSRILVCSGGESRQGSVYEGLKKLKAYRLQEGDKSSSEWVMIHDAARPLLTLGLLDQLWTERRMALTDKQVAGVVPGVAVSEAVKEVQVNLHHGIGLQTLDRTKLRIIQTPQLLLGEVLFKALEELSDENAVDDSSLVEKLGYKVIVIDGETENIKVTFSEDRERVSNWLRNRHPSL